MSTHRTTPPPRETRAAPRTCPPRPSKVETKVRPKVSERETNQSRGASSQPTKPSDNDLELQSVWWSHLDRNSKLASLHTGPSRANWDSSPERWYPTTRRLWVSIHPFSSLFSVLQSFDLSQYQDSDIIHQSGLLLNKIAKAPVSFLETWLAFNLLEQDHSFQSEFSARLLLVEIWIRNS